MPTDTEEIKNRVDIVDLIQEYVRLKQAGANWKGLCPFHNEKTPSFTVSRDKQFFHCFGCLEGGDIFAFLQKIDGLEFPEALKILAEKAGVELKRQDPQLRSKKTRIYEINREAAEYFQTSLNGEGPAARVRQYLLEKRNLKPETVKEFGLGFAPDSWDALSKHLKTKGYKEPEIIESGLAVQKSQVIGASGQGYYDRFRDRLMFPIQDTHGNIVGFTARALKDSEGAKYINTPQTLVYNKSRVLYGLDKAKKIIREKDLAIVVEGNMDVIASHQAAVTNVVASSGTALTQDQINILKRYTSNVAFAFDSDAAGLAALERGIDLVWQADMNVKVIVLPDGAKDPDELISKDSISWSKVSQDSVNFMDFLISKALEVRDITRVEEKKMVAHKLLGVLAKLKDPIEVDHYLKAIAEKLGVEESTLRQALPGKKQRVEPAEVEILPKADRHQLVSERVMAVCLARPELTEMIVGQVEPEVLFGEYRELYKEFIVYYTETQEFNLAEYKNQLSTASSTQNQLIDTLALLGESEYLGSDKEELEQEIKDTALWLKKRDLQAKLKKISQELARVEQAQEKDALASLGQEFTRLTRELAQLK